MFASTGSYMSSFVKNYHHEINKYSDDKFLCLLNKFLKDKILDIFIENAELFGHKINLKDFYIEYDCNDHNTLNLCMPKYVKDFVKQIVNKDNLIIKVNLF